MSRCLRQQTEDPGGLTLRSLFEQLTSLGIWCVLWLVLGSCSLHTFPRIGCEDDADCEAFGLGCNLENGLCTEMCSSNAQCLGDAYYGRLCASDATCQPPPPRARCSRTFPSDLYDHPEDFRLIVATLFDPSQPTHLARERSAQLAVRQANDNGGLEDGLVGMIHCSLEPDMPDALSRRDAAVANAIWLRDIWQVSAIIGPASSGDTQAVFEAVGEDTFVVSPSATSPALTYLDGTDPNDANPGLLWRTAPPDSFQGLIIAADLNTRRVEQVSVIAEMGAYGQGLVDVFNDAYTGSGLEILLYEEGNDSQRDEQIIAATAHEVLFVSSQTEDVIAFLRVAATPLYEGRNVFLTDAAATAEVTMIIDDELHGRIRGTRPSLIANVVYDNFSASYAAAYGEEVNQFTFTAHAMDAAWVALYGAAWSVARGLSPNGLSIARGARHLSEGIELPLIGSSWPIAQNAFQNGRDVNIMGASGMLDFDPVTEEIAAPIEVWTVNTCGDENVIESLPLAGMIHPCE